MNLTPQKIWSEIWIENDNKVLIDMIWSKILKAYSSKGRYYHNLNHVENMLVASSLYADKVYDLKTLQLAIFYHDIIYSVRKKDNEEQSAKAAEKDLEILQYPPKLIEKCKQYIIATKSHANLLNDNDLNFLLDFDLEILGVKWALYHEYTQQIRKEYQIYPDIIYKPGRKKVLEHFLALERIYKTQEYIDKFEAQAKFNLLKELEMLK